MSRSSGPGGTRTRADPRAFAVLGGLVFAAGGSDPWQVAAGAGMGAASGWLAAIDLTSHRLPNRVLLPTSLALATTITVHALATGDGAAARGAAAGALAIAAALLLFALVTRGGLGLGDVKFGALLGMWAGWLALLAPVVVVASAFLTGGVVALVGMARGTTTPSTRIPFGPMLAVGGAVATWWVGLAT